MKILYYCLPLNERFYADYNVNGLRLNGHEVEYTLEHDKSRYVDFNDPKYLKNFDLVIYMGFSHGNMTCHQNLTYHPGLESGVKFIVLYYDNPFRYMNILPLLLRSKNAYVGCCDGELTLRMKTIGFNALWVPTCFDPHIQYRTNPKKEYNYDFSFAGTVLDKKKIEELNTGKNICEINMLIEMEHKRKKLEFFDYSDYLSNVFRCDFTHKDFGELCFINLMNQKYLLRMEMFEALHEIGEIHIHGQGNWLPEYKNIFHHKNLDQHNELPDVYRSAKINLSIELLPASVHQRIMEIGGCGGFPLMENKADNTLCFDSKELTEDIVWHNENELRDKAKFYLKNESERNRISDILHEECMKRHTCQIRMSELIDSLK